MIGLNYGNLTTEKFEAVPEILFQFFQLFNFDSIKESTDVKMV